MYKLAIHFSVCPTAMPVKRSCVNRREGGCLVALWIVQMLHVMMHHVLYHPVRQSPHSSQEGGLLLALWICRKLHVMFLFVIV